jgi:hypothetical protein
MPAGPRTANPSRAGTLTRRNGGRQRLEPWTQRLTASGFDRVILTGLDCRASTYGFRLLQDHAVAPWRGWGCVGNGLFPVGFRSRRLAGWSHHRRSPACSLTSPILPGFGPTCATTGTSKRPHPASWHPSQPRHQHPGPHGRSPTRQAKACFLLGYLKTMVRLPFRRTRRSTCHWTARASARHSASRPAMASWSASWVWSTRMTSCSMIGPSSRSGVT